MRLTRPHGKGQQEGFTLPLMVVLLTIAAMVAATVFTKSKREEFWEPRLVTQQRLQSIADALVAYQRQYGRLPCPAPPLVHFSTASQGQSISCGSKERVASGGSFIENGGVPYRELKLSPQTWEDAWGNQIRYAVSENLYPAASLRTQNGVIRIEGESGLLSTSAAFVLVSYGENKSGGGRMVSPTAFFSNGCATSLPESHNCGNTATYYAGSMQVTHPTGYNDDIVVWQEVDPIARGM